MTKMKDSGIEWIGEIPETWSIQPISKMFKQRNSKVSDFDYAPLSVTKQGIVPQLESAAKSDDHTNRKLVKKFDFVINSRSDRKMSSGVSQLDGSVSLINLVMKYDHTELYPAFVNYLMKNYGFAEEFYRWGTGIVADLWSTNWERGKKIQIPVPTVEEQQAIADFLDEKVAKINEIIADTKLSIERLKDYKRSVITETVTKGLNCNIKMKDSGVEWIGQININTYVCKLKYLLKSSLIYGANESGIEYSDQLPRYIRITDIDSNGKLKQKDKLSLEERISLPYLMNDKDILFARSGGTVGKTFLYKSEYGKSAFAGYLIKASLDEQKILPEYFYYYTQSSLYESWKNQIFIQSTIQNIGVDKYNQLPVILQDVSLQNSIVSYLDEKTDSINKLISDKETLITKYEDYKKSLIYEYVTGKKQVM